MGTTTLADTLKSIRANLEFAQARSDQYDEEFQDDGAINFALLACGELPEGGEYHRLWMRLHLAASHQRQRNLFSYRRMIEEALEVVEQLIAAADREPEIDDLHTQLESLLDVVWRQERAW